MKTISIYTDIRKSKKFSLSEKKQKYTKLYTQFSSFKPSLKNMSHRTTKYVGDGVILIFDANKLTNEKELVNLLKKIDDKVKILEEQNNMEMGIGISYSEAFEGGNPDLFISPSIDGACYGVNLANKFKINYKKWKWVLPLKVGDDGLNSISLLKNILTKSSKIDSHRSISRKNLWFKFK